MMLTKAEFGYYIDLISIVSQKICNEDLPVDCEIMAVGAGLGGCFENTRDIKVIK